MTRARRVLRFAVMWLAVWIAGLLVGMDAGGSGPVFRDQDLREQSLAGLNLRGALLENVVAWKADLRGADLRGAQLFEVDLRDADLRGVRLDGAVYDRFTRWPAGFDPMEHGATLDD